MKIAQPLALVACGVILVVLLMSPRHWKERNDADHQSDQDKIEQAKQIWFEKHPEIKSEELDLQQREQQAEKASREAKDNWYELHRSKRDHDQKVRDELIKSDSSLKPVYDRLEFDERVPFGWGDQKLFVEYGFHPRSPLDLFLAVLFYVFPAVTIGVSIFLLVRPPSWAGAHLFLIFVILPLVFLGPITLRAATIVYLTRFDQIGDYSSVPDMLLGIYSNLTRDYLSCVPSLLLYVALLFRIYLREQKEKHAGAQ